MLSFTTPDGTTRVTVNGDVTTKEPVEVWRARLASNARQREIDTILANYPLASLFDTSVELDVWIVDDRMEVLCTLAAAVEIENSGHRVRTHPTKVSVTKLYCCIGRMIRYGDERNPQRARLEAVKPSTAQGWDLFLEGGVKLQSCFVTGIYELA